MSAQREEVTLGNAPFQRAVGKRQPLRYGKGMRCAGGYPKGTCDPTLRGRVGIRPYNMTGGVLQTMQEHIFSTINCQLSTVNCQLSTVNSRTRRALTPQSATPVPFFIFIVIVEKKITVTVIFFSTVVGIVIGIHCIAIKRRLEKVRGIGLINK